MSHRIAKEQVERIVRQVRAKVQETIGAPRVSADGSHDVVQDVLLTILRKLPFFDPARATLETFVARVTEHALVDRARRLSAHKRTPDGHLGNHPAVSSSAQVDPTSAKSARHRDLSIDLQEALSQLPPELERLARDLQCWTPTEIAQRDGVNRGTIHRRMSQLRQRWEDSSLRDYLDP